MHNQKITIRYLAELLGANLLFFLVEWLSTKIGMGMPNGIEKTCVLLSPILPVLLMIVVVVRCFHRIDEYLRLQMLENLALTTAVIFIGTFVYGSLETMGFPGVSMFSICPALGITFAIVSTVRRIAIR
jgi:hypothetical protein